MQHILVAVDGSESSKKAAHFAAELAHQTGAQLSLLLVLEPPTVTPFAPMESYAVTRAGTSKEAMESAKTVLDEIVRELPKGQGDPIIEIGPAAETILSKAASLSIDHVIVGARGLGRGGRWLLGSVSDRVVRHSHCPVTVVR